MIKILKSFFF